MQLADTNAFKDIPRERYHEALYMIFKEGLKQNPILLVAIVESGEEKWVSTCMDTDVYGITRDEYRKVYKRLCRLAKRWKITAAQIHS